MANAERITDWDQLYPGRFFKGGDIELGVKKVVMITEVDVEELEGDKGKKGKGILTLAGEKMQLPLNKTNGICLREMFGRVPYKWVGKRFAMFQSEHDGEPAIRIWGSPDIAEDMVITIDLGRRRKPFKMTMHAMGDERSLKRAGQKAGQRLTSVPANEELGERATEILKMMAGATDVDTLQDIEANIVGETFNRREIRAIQAGVAKRRSQILAAEAQKEDEDGDIPY